MRCGEQWALAPSAVAPPASPPPAGPGLPAGNYYIQSAGRAGEGNAACATYLGYGACGTGTGIGEMANTNPGVVTWAVAPVAGVAGAYTIVAGGRKTCDPATFLGAPTCASGSNAPALAPANDGTGSQARARRLLIIEADANPCGSLRDPEVQDGIGFRVVPGFPCLPPCCTPRSHPRAARLHGFRRWSVPKGATPIYLSISLSTPLKEDCCSTAGTNTPLHPMHKMQEVPYPQGMRGAVALGRWRAGAAQVQLPGGVGAEKSGEMGHVACEWGWQVAGKRKEYYKKQWLKRSFGRSPDGLWSCGR